MLIKWTVGLFFIAILYCLASGVFYIAKRGSGIALARALTWRALLSVFLFLFIILGYYLGWFMPAGL